MDFSQLLLSWYVKNRRELPWRKTRDPYKIWLSEVILQQTRVQQGLPYYFAFVKKYPDVKKLARAPEDEVLKLWQGLGYYSRARNLHAAAKMVVKDFDGKFPGNYEALRKLKGIGDYTAAAIASISFEERKAVVDGNVYRVLSRIFGIEEAIDSTNGKKTFATLANELIPEKLPSEHNQAIMEFGALQCVPKNPDCEHCPFVMYCHARKKKTVHLLPVKSKKTKVTDRYFYYLVIHHRGNVYLKQRTEKDIWKGLFDFPLIETKKAVAEKKLFQSQEWISIFGKEKIIPRKISAEVKHILSHQKLHIRFIDVELKNKLKGKNLLYIKEKELKKYAVPVVIANYIREGHGTIDK